MRKTYYLGCLILTLLICSCKCHQADDITKNSSVDTTHFFPVVDFINGDINDVKHVPYFIFKIKTINKKKDSANLTVAEFERYAQKFMQYDITKPPLKAQLKETSFHDNTTKSNTLVYTPVDANVGNIRDITVLLDEKTDRVKNIFIQTFKRIKDTTISENLQWKSRKSFRITTIKQAKNYDNEETDYISWNEASN